MAIKHSPGCTCCGCGIFAFDDVLSAESGTTVIDGYTVIDKKLPAGGLWYVACTSFLTGTATSTTQKFHYRLLKDDDSVFAEWSVGLYFKDDSYFVIGVEVDKLAYVRTLSMDWNGNTFSDEIVSPASGFGVSDIDVELENRNIRTFTVVGRKECSLYRTGLPGAFSGKAISDNIQGPSNEAVFGDGVQLDDTFVDSDTGGKFVLLGGIPLANDSADFVAAGTLRLGCKFVADPGTNTGAISATAEKIYQEPVACTDEYTYYYDDSFSLAEKNEGCEWPVICPVTAPHYTTPDWEVKSASSFLNGTELGYEIGACITTLFHYSAAATTAAEGNPTNDIEVGLYRTLGDDFPALFSHLEPTGTDPPTEHTALVFKHTGGSFTDKDNWSTGYDLTFKDTAFPFNIELSVVATDDPCRWKIVATVTVFAWTVSQSVATTADAWNMTGSTSLDFFVTLQSKHLNSGTVFFTNPQTDNALYGTRIVGPTFSSHQWTFEEEVDTWLHEPPTITFNSSNQTSSTSGSVYFLTGINSPRVENNTGTTLRFFVQADAIEVPRLFGHSITIGPRTSPRVPHP